MQEGDLAICYASVWQAVFAVVEVISDPEEDPERDRWRWSFRIRPLVALRSWAVAGVGPEVMGIGPVPATAAALARADLTLDDLDLIELNEAFAAQVLACLREWKLDPTDERLNPNGSGISLGHPLGATGARILATLSHELHRRNGRYALETICIGGGQGIAAIFEAVR